MENFWGNEKLIQVLKNGGVAVMPTDTIYGIVGSALNKDSVEKIYDLRKRNKEKPCIILISSIDDLKKFSIDVGDTEKNIIKEYWENLNNPKPTSIVFDCNNEDYKYLHRGTKTLAFRLPKNLYLRDLVAETGPLVAPSANIEGEPFSLNTQDAKKYFGEAVDLYIDGGEINGSASTVIKLHKDGTHTILRA